MKNKYGWSVGDRGIVTSKTSFMANFGDILTLVEDDGTECPYFTGSTAFKFMQRVSCNYMNFEKIDTPEMKLPDTDKLVLGYKFKVTSPEQSKRLQKVLFKLGYTWWGKSTEVLTCPHSEVYINKSCKSITQSSDRTCFDKHEYKEADIEWLTKI